MAFEKAMEKFGYYYYCYGITLDALKQKEQWLQ